MNQQYKAFGLKIVSQLSLPELLEGEFTDSPDVVIKYGRVPNKMDDPKHEGILFQAKTDNFLLKVPKIAQYYITNGKLIIVQPEEGSTNQAIKLFLLGSAFGALLHQRKTLILHASAVKVEESAILFTGISGVGKSSIANAFRLKGHSILTDDICPIRITGKKSFAISGYPQSKLWQDSMENFNISNNHLSRIRNKINKWAIPLNGSFCEESLPIKAIYFLKIFNEKQVRIDPINGAQKFKILKEMTYRKMFIKGLNVVDSHFKQSMQLAMNTPIKVIRRPRSETGFYTDQMINLITEDFKS